MKTKTKILPLLITFLLINILIVNAQPYENTTHPSQNRFFNEKGDIADFFQPLYIDGDFIKLNNHDGKLTYNIPTTNSYIFCGAFIFLHFQEDSVSDTEDMVIDNIYLRLYQSNFTTNLHSANIKFAYNLTNESSWQRHWHERYQINAGDYLRTNNIIHPYNTDVTYRLMTLKIDHWNQQNLTFSPANSAIDALKFIQIGGGGGSPSATDFSGPNVTSNPNMHSFLLFNVPDNQTLNTTDFSYMGLGGGVGDITGDGLTVWEELYIYHTNPFVTDTDGDGYSDYDEIQSGTDPNNYLDFPEDPSIYTISGRITKTSTTQPIIPLPERIEKNITTDTISNDPRGIIDQIGFINAGGSNSIGVADVILVSDDGVILATTDSNGYYSFTRPHGWSGTITPGTIIPAKTYSFSPSSRIYTDLDGNQINQNYTAYTVYYTISGIVTIQNHGGIEGVELRNGNELITTTATGGFYSFTKPQGWSGAITLHKQGYGNWNPEINIYKHLSQHYFDHNYEGTVAGPDDDFD